MQRRKFVQLSGLSLIGTVAIPTGLSARSASTQFNGDWRYFTAQKSVSRSYSSLPEEVTIKLQETLPAGVEYEQRHAIYHYSTPQGKIYFTAFELKTSVERLGQYLVPLWQQNTENSKFQLMLMNGSELATLVTASAKSGLALLPQLTDQGSSAAIPTNHGELQNKVRWESRKCSHEWALAQNSKVFDSGSFARTNKNSLFWS